MDARQSSSSPPVFDRRAALTRLAACSALAPLLAASTHGSAKTQATPAGASESPNTFRLSGDDTSIDYATTSFDGSPTLTYRGPAGEGDFRGDAIHTASAPFGELVTVTVDVAHDAFRLDLTLVLPGVKLVGDNEPAELSTFAILTNHRMHIGGPRFVEGARQTYEIVPLEGTAEILWY